ncbi:MAG: STAS/SEC14 domain-containing protein [Bacteroidota bacterium]
MKCFEDNLVKVFYYEEFKTGLGTWRGNGIGEDYKKSMSRISNLIAEKNIEGWVAEISNFGVVSKENKDWVNTVWFPSVIGAGLKRMAVVIPSNIFGKMSAEEVLAKVTDQVHIKHFDKLDSARAWIKSEVMVS